MFLADRCEHEPLAELQGEWENTTWLGDVVP